MLGFKNSNLLNANLLDASTVRKFHLKTIGFLLLFVITFASGYAAASKGWFASQKTPTTAGNERFDLSLLWKVYDLLKKDYLGKDRIITEDLLYGAISGMVSSLGDPYTSFYTPEANNQFKESLDGLYEGIGAELGFRDSQLVIIAPLPGLPAEKAGIAAGDAILQVDGEDTSGWSLPKAISEIRGAEGTAVTLTISRDGKDSFELEILRAKIKVPNVILEWKEGHIAYLKIYRFGTDIREDWDKEIAKIKEQRAKLEGIILDVRGNPGGLLDGAVYLASEFFDKGVIVKRRLADGKIEEFGVDHQGKLTDIPIVVLINEGSASASEILAGSLQVRARAKLVGVKSFGKGTVQEPFELDGGAGLHITTAEWLLPDATSIEEVGLVPDVAVEMTEEDVKAGKDPQLAKALELLEQ